MNKRTQQLIITATQYHYQGIPESTTIESATYLGITLEQTSTRENI